ncbi:RNA pseudouridylate synthase domain-containing protein 1 [Nymphon striatum]|nr:RNA pseudouridylate synthase domain-containing protein 1 [Nymphon striatum]
MVGPTMKYMVAWGPTMIYMVGYICVDYDLHGRSIMIYMVPCIWSPLLVAEKFRPYKSWSDDYYSSGRHNHNLYGTSRLYHKFHGQQPLTIIFMVATTIIYMAQYNIRNDQKKKPHQSDLGKVSFWAKFKMADRVPYTKILKFQLDAKKTLHTTQIWEPLALCVDYTYDHYYQKTKFRYELHNLTTFCTFIRLIPSTVCLGAKELGRYGFGRVVSMVIVNFSNSLHVLNYFNEPDDLNQPEINSGEVAKAFLEISVSLRDPKVLLDLKLSYGGLKPRWIISKWIKHLSISPRASVSIISKQRSLITNFHPYMVLEMAEKLTWQIFLQHSDVAPWLRCRARGLITVTLQKCKRFDKDCAPSVWSDHWVRILNNKGQRGGVKTVTIFLFFWKVALKHLLLFADLNSTIFIPIEYQSADVTVTKSLSVVITSKNDDDTFSGYNATASIDKGPFEIAFKRRSFIRKLGVENSLHEFQFCVFNLTQTQTPTPTGRRHHLRVHCNYLGHTIVGDYTYSNSKDTLPHRMFLHAYKIVMPTTLEYVSVVTEDPFSETIYDVFSYHYQEIKLLYFYSRTGPLLSKGLRSRSPVLSTGSSFHPIPVKLSYIIHPPSFRFSPFSSSPICYPNCGFSGPSIVCSTGQVSGPVPLATLHCLGQIFTPCVCPHPTCEALVIVNFSNACLIYRMILTSIESIMEYKKNMGRQFYHSSMPILTTKFVSVPQASFPTIDINHIIETCLDLYTSKYKSNFPMCKRQQFLITLIVKPTCAYKLALNSSSSSSVRAGSVGMSSTTSSIKQLSSLYQFSSAVKFCFSEKSSKNPTVFSICKHNHSLVDNLKTNFSSDFHEESSRIFKITLYIVSVMCSTPTICLGSPKLYEYIDLYRTTNRSISFQKCPDIGKQICNTMEELVHHPLTFVLMKVFTKLVLLLAEFSSLTIS